MQRFLLLVIAFAILGFLVGVFASTASALHQGGAQTPILAGQNADGRVVQIFQRSCQNCHSYNTEWPLYGRFFPFSMVIESDVRTARAHMNLSRWPNYAPAEKRHILAEIGSVVRTHIMPPRRYTLLHPGATLTEDERNEIYLWTKARRKEIKDAAGR